VKGGAVLPPPRNRKRKEKMNDTLILLFVLAVWVFVQAWLLPRMGVST
jgi:hypothetical protein